jgi:hypothetical protein
MADWKQIGGQVVAAGAPILGRIIGEFIPFPGGGTLAEWGIRKLAEALGIKPEDATPDSLGNAIQNTPSDVLQGKLAAAESEAKARWDAIAEIAKAHAEQNTASAQAINQTIREDNARGPSWWHWRHLIGYVTMAQGAVFVAGSAKIMFLGGDIAALAALVTAITPIFLGLAALNGYVAADTTALKVAAITGQPAPTAVTAVVDAVKAKKK